MYHYKNKRHSQCDGQYNLNPSKKGDMDPKDKESKIPRVREGKDPHGLEDHPRFPLKTLANQKENSYWRLNQD